VPAPITSLEAAQIFQLKIVEFHEFTEIEGRLWITVIERSEVSWIGAQIDESDVVLSQY